MYKTFCIFWLLFYLANLQTFENFKQSMENKVKDLAAQMASIYARRCEPDILQCQIKSFNKCEGTDEKICYQDFPDPPNCLSNGAYLSKSSAIRFPLSVNVSNLTEEDRLFVCASAALEPKFEALNNNRNRQYGSAFIGTTFGSMRTYPTYRQTDQKFQCVDYDPRYRPWYVTATSGGKNIILIIDVSGSMQGQKLNLAKQASKSVINTLSNNDFIGVIKFSSSASALGSSQRIKRATASYKEQLIDLINSLSAIGSTNYEAAIRLGFNMIQRAERDEFGAPCYNAENVFLFLTDGKPTQMSLTSESLIKSINSFFSDFNITMFTYGLGSNINPQILKDLACEYNGIFFAVQDQTSSFFSLTKIMRSYFTYMSEGISIENPIWTQPYQDFFGFGQLVTVSMPIYYQEGKIRKILGVAGIDVSMPTFETLFGLTDSVQITKKLISGIPCTQSTLTQCDLENLRSESSRCGVRNCSIQNQELRSCSISNNIFKTSLTTDQSLCCGLTIGALVGILVGSIVPVLAIAIGCTVYCCKKRRKIIKQNKKRQKKNQEMAKELQKKQPVIVNNAITQQYPGYFYQPPSQQRLR